MSPQYDILVRTLKPYHVHVGAGLLPQAGGLLAQMHSGGGRIAVVTDDMVYSLHCSAILASLREAGFTPEVMVIPSGESSKNLETCGRILNFLAECQLSRDDCAVALGGGVVGDLTGFASAIYLRGIKFIQVPTTLLGMVDSSVGGKTGVDLHSGKNLAGAFHQPSMVLCDTDVLSTLPEETLEAGASEAIKSAVLGDERLFSLLSLPCWKQHLPEIIFRAVTLKAQIVERDEFDVGERHVLNFGHTIGHAVEAASNYAMPHGFAVSIGMVAATRAAVAHGMASEELLAQLLEVLHLHNLPVELPMPLNEIVPFLAFDKKRSRENLTIVVPDRVGACHLMQCSLDKAMDFFKENAK